MILSEIRAKFVEASGRSDLSSSDIGGDLVYNGGFDHSPYGWHLSDSKWTHGSGKITHAAGATGHLIQYPPFIQMVSGYYYQTSFTISGYSAGSVQISLGDGTSSTSLGTTRSSNGTFVENIMCSYPPHLRFVPTTTFVGSIDDVSVKNLDSVALGSGADFFINAGIKMLDAMVTTPKTVARYQKDLAVGTYLLTFKNCRAIKEVWIVNDEGERTQLKKKSIQELSELYGEDWEEIDNGTPYYYAINAVGLSPQQHDLEDDTYTSDFTRRHEDLILTDVVGGITHFDSDGIVIMPPPDEAITVEVWGMFESLELSAAGDANYWTVRYPMLVVQAACYQLESFYRNSEGMKDWMSAMLPTIDGIRKDRTEEAIAAIDRMKG